MLKVRSAAPGDALAICDVHRRSILELGLEGYTEAEVESWAHGLEPERYRHAMLHFGESYAVAVEEDGFLAGFCSYKDAELTALYVHPDRTRRGVGSQLIQHAEAELYRSGFRTFRISASRNGQAFYEKHGYRVVETGVWKTRGGLSVARLEMRKTVHPKSPGL